MNVIIIQNWTMGIGKDQTRLLLCIYNKYNRCPKGVGEGVRIHLQMMNGWLKWPHSPSMPEARTGKRSRRSSRGRHERQHPRMRRRRPVCRGRILMVQATHHHHDGWFVLGQLVEASWWLVEPAPRHLWNNINNRTFTKQYNTYSNSKTETVNQLARVIYEDT